MRQLRVRGPRQKRVRGIVPQKALQQKPPLRVLPARLCSLQLIHLQVLRWLATGTTAMAPMDRSLSRTRVRQRVEQLSDLPGLMQWLLGDSCLGQRHVVGFWVHTFHCFQMNSCRTWQFFKVRQRGGMGPHSQFSVGQFNVLHFWMRMLLELRKVRWKGIWNSLNLKLLAKNRRKTSSKDTSKGWEMRTDTSQ